MKKRMISVLSVILALTVLFTACGSKGESGGGKGSSAAGQDVTVAGPVDLAAAYALPANTLQDMTTWSQGTAEFQDEPGTLDQNQVIDYRAEREVVEEYVHMLQRNGYTLVDEYNEFKELHAWGFICDAAPDAQTLEMMFTDTPCHLSIHWTDSSRRKFTFYVSPDIQVCDTGLRRDGSVADILPKGESAGAGLIRLADGSYQTSDGRLTAAPGTAMVIRDGVVCNTSARYCVSGGGEQFWIENYYRNEGIFLESPENYLMAGDMFRRDELVRWRPIEKHQDSLDGFVYHYPTLAIAHGEYWVGPGMNEEFYDALFLRVMHYDKGGDAVLYIYGRFLESEPTEVEALCVVNTSYENGGAIEDATYMKPGNTLTLKYTHTEFGSSYHTYDWTIVEGEDKVKINGVGNSCDVTAVSPGVATVSVTYHYSKEEPDVLTGIPRNVGHSIVETYHFIIE